MGAAAGKPTDSPAGRGWRYSTLANKWEFEQMERWSQHLAKKKQNGTGPQENKTKPVPRKTSPSFPVCNIRLTVVLSERFSNAPLLQLSHVSLLWEYFCVCVSNKVFQSSQEGYSQQRGKCLVKSSLCWELFFLLLYWQLRQFERFGSSTDRKIWLRKSWVKTIVRTRVISIGTHRPSDGSKTHMWLWLRS